MNSSGQGEAVSEADPKLGQGFEKPAGDVGSRGRRPIPSLLKEEAGPCCWNPNYCLDPQTQFPPPPRTRHICCGR